MKNKEILGKIKLDDVLNTLPEFEEDFAGLRENKVLLGEMLKDDLLRETVGLPRNVVENSYQKTIDKIQNYKAIINDQADLKYNLN